VAVGAAGVSVGAAAVGVGVAALELLGLSHPDIWSNPWAVGGVVIGGIGLLIAVAVVVIGLFRFTVFLFRREAAASPPDRDQETPSTRTVSTSVTSQRSPLGHDHVRAGQEILVGLSEIINEIAGVPTDAVTPDKDFVDDLGIDSLSMVEIAVVAQDKFGVEISDKQLKSIKTVQDLINFLTDKL
jgi:acyl carrier protein